MKRGNSATPLRLTAPSSYAKSLQVGWGREPSGTIPLSALRGLARCLLRSIAPELIAGFGTPWSLRSSACGRLAFLIQGEAPAPAGWVLLTVGLVFVALLSLVAWPVDYDPGAGGPDGEPILLVRSGLLRYRIPLEEISEVRPSTEAWSSPAWSLDRLKVVYPTRSGFHRSLLISRRDRDGFLDELARRGSPRARGRQPGAKGSSAALASAIVNGEVAFGGDQERRPTRSGPIG